MEVKSNRVGIEVSGSRFHAVSVDETGAIAGTVSADVVSDEDQSAQLVSFVKKLKTELGDFSRAGISFPGLVDRDAQRIAFSAQIPEHSKVDLVREIRSALGVEVLIENDANAAAYGEFMLGAGRGSQNLFYVTLGTGVGGAFIFNGEIWRGAAGFAGEFDMCRSILREPGLKMLLPLPTSSAAFAAASIRTIRHR